MTLTVTFLKWFDASNQVGWGPLKPEEFVPRVILYSAGILAAEDDETVSLAIDHYDGAGTYRHVVHIPIVNIIKRRDIKVAV
jgi:hypothetical protein